MMYKELTSRGKLETSGREVNKEYNKTMGTHNDQKPGEYPGTMPMGIEIVTISRSQHDLTQRGHLQQSIQDTKLRRVAESVASRGHLDGQDECNQQSEGIHIA